MGVKMQKMKVILNKPIYLVPTILDLSKATKYEFHYHYMKPKYPGRIQPCYLDTDSFVYHIKTDDFYEDIANDIYQRFDTSTYDKKDKRPLPIGLNKKVIGLMKDELGGKIKTEFVSLRAKTYAYKFWNFGILIDGKEDKKCKLVKKCAVKETLGFNDYKECLKDGIPKYAEQMAFRTDKHDVYTINQKKIALCRDDDKRIILEDGILIFFRCLLFKSMKVNEFFEFLFYVKIDS